MIIKTTEYNLKLFNIFIKWYFFEIPSKILKQTYEYIIAISQIYSFIFLLKTLFYPWKGQIYAYQEKGFDIGFIMKVWTANMVSRIIGAIIRFFTIITGLIISIVVFILGLFVWVIWFTYPVLFFILVINSFI